MKKVSQIRLKLGIAVSATMLLSASLAVSAEANTRTFAENHKAKFKGVILSHEGDKLTVRGTDDSISTVDLTHKTKVRLKRGMFEEDKAIKADSLAIGLYIEVSGKGNEKGDLVAHKIVFDPKSMTVSRQADARVQPVEARTGALETRAGSLEGRAGQMEDRQGKLDEKQKQTDQQVNQVSDRVTQVKTEADQANQGVDSVNQRVSNLDNYQEKYSEIVYFKLNSSTLTPEYKQKLDNLAQQAKNEKGYSVQVAGYADNTGNASYNQRLSEARAIAVIQYLEQQGDIPINRILAPAGLGTTHEAADNRTSAGRKLNRRVEVKVLVNQGLVSSSEKTATAKLPGN